MISLLFNFVISSFRGAKNYHLRQAKTGETRESWATTLFIFKTSHLFDLFFLQ